MAHFDDYDLRVVVCVIICAVSFFAVEQLITHTVVALAGYAGWLFQVFTGDATFWAIIGLGVVSVIYLFLGWKSLDERLFWDAAGKMLTGYDD